MREQKSLRRETDKAMNTEIIQIDRNNIDKEKITHCAEVIRKDPDFFLKTHTRSLNFIELEIM